MDEENGCLRVGFRAVFRLIARTTDLNIDSFRSRSSTAVYTSFKCYVLRRYLRSSFEMLFKRLKDRLTVKQAMFWIISGRKDKYMILTYPTLLKKNMNIACFQIYGIVKDDFR